MNGYRWLMRAALWVRNPPSEKRVKFFVAILAVCLAIGFIEYYVGWPEWATAERVTRFPK
ncbi:MAG: hypothetical protein OXC60_14325 [Litoreibacter sp.]|nr:hypothetical protein [Litoreibacter sp.]